MREHRLNLVQIAAMLGFAEVVALYCVVTRLAKDVDPRRVLLLASWIRIV
jgi:hypothetical protein